MTTISRTEFNKKVEVEFAYLSYVERMPADKAQKTALANISKQYQVV